MTERRRRRTLAWLAVGGAVAASIGCGQAPTATPTLPVTLVDWTALAREVIVPSCAFGSCHAGAQPAAHLDLSQPSSCRALVTQRSCLFPDRPLIVAGDPTGSFLLAKLTGQGLDARPQTTCGGATNQRMPFGAQPLPQAQIDALSAWVAAGAACPDAEPPGAAPTLAPPAAPPPLPPVVLTGLDVPARPMVAGRQDVLTVRLGGVAAAGGTAVALSVDDRTILGAPALLLVPEGASAATVLVIGKRPGRTRVSAHLENGTETQSALVTVAGLAFAEIATGGEAASSWVKLANISDAPIDLGGYRLTVGAGTRDDAATRLAGILGPGACYLVGGSPPAAGPPDAPSLVWDLSVPTSAALSGTAPVLAFGLADGAAPAGAADAAAAVDAVAFGRLDGPPSASMVPLPDASASAVRRGMNRWERQAPPTPQQCDVSFGQSWPDARD